MPPIPYTLGIDVFHGDGPIAWPAVLTAGYSFGFAKATEGTPPNDSVPSAIVPVGIPNAAPLP